MEVEKHKKMKSLNETFSLPSMSNKEREVKKLYEVHNFFISGDA